MKLFCKQYLSKELSGFYKRVAFIGFISVAIFCSVIAVPYHVSAVPLYHVVDLGTLGGSGSLGYSINNEGQVTGWAENSSGNHHAFIYDHSTQSMVSIHNPPDSVYTDSIGFGINDNGDVTGTLNGPPHTSHAFLYTSGGSMETIIDDAWSAGMAINNSGKVVGTTNPGTAGTKAFLYSNADVLTYIDPLPGDPVNNGNGINNYEQVTGQSHDFAGVGSAYIDSGGDKDDLGTLGGDEGEGRDINDSGHVVGFSETSNGEIHGFFMMEAIL